MHANFFLESLKQQAQLPPQRRRIARFNSRSQSRHQREHPVAVCTRCRALSFSASMINQPCSRTRADSPCTGKFACTLSANHWQKCLICEATGWQGRMVCSHCQSLGWLFAGRH